MFISIFLCAVDWILGNWEVVVIEHLELHLVLTILVSQYVTTLIARSHIRTNQLDFGNIHYQCVCLYTGPAA